MTASVATGLPNPEQMVTGGTAEPAKAGLTVKPVAVTQEECESAADAVMPLEGGGGNSATCGTSALPEASLAVVEPNEGKATVGGAEGSCVARKDRAK